MDKVREEAEQGAAYADIGRVQKAIQTLIGVPAAERFMGASGQLRIVRESDLQQLAEQARLEVQEASVAQQVATAQAEGFDVGRVWYQAVPSSGQVLYSERSDSSAAEAAGFDTQNSWYHGTTSSRHFRQFKAGVKGFDELGRGIYFTSDPDVAQAWAGRPGDGGRIIPVYLRKGDVFDLSQPVDYEALARRIQATCPVTDDERRAAEIRRNKDVQDWTPEEQSIFNRAAQDPWRSWLLESVQDLARWIKQSSARGGSFNVWLERAGYVGAVNPRSQIRGQIVVFRPSDIRSPWARFNPARADSADLLHSAPWQPAQTHQGYAFHVTPAVNVDSILRHGIEPRVGTRSAAMGESGPASYYFTGMDEMADAMGNWLGDEFEEDEPLALFAVRRDMAWLEVNSQAGYEAVAKRTVDPDALMLVSKDLDTETDLQVALERAARDNVDPVYFHGTSAGDFGELRPSQRGMFGTGIYLTSRRGSAMAYAEGGGDGEPRVLEVGVRMANPLWVRADYQDGHAHDLESAAVPLIEKLFGEQSAEMLSASRRLDGMFGPEVMEAAQSMGHDGLVLEWSDGVRDCVAFDTSQVQRHRPWPEMAEDFAPGFADWFKGSRVVDEAGQPRVVYHGTIVWERDGRQLGDIEQFDRMASVNIVRRRPSMDTLGSWFSTNPGEGGAGMYANATGAIYPVYLNIKKPFVTTFAAMNDRARALGRLAPSDFVDGPSVERFREWLATEGFDGVKIVHDDASESTEFSRQDAWIALGPEQIRFALGARAVVRCNASAREGLYPRASAEILASLAPRGLDRLLREQRAAKARSLAAIGEVGEGVTLRSRSGDRWRLVLPDASEPGKWRGQAFDGAGFSGHVTYGTKEEAVEGAVRDGFWVRDDGALDRLQDTPAFQRGLYVTELVRQVNSGVISLAEGDRRMAVYDAEMAALADVASKSAQAFCMQQSGTVALIADRIAPGEEGAVFLHEIVHKNGLRVLGSGALDRLVRQVQSWEVAPIGSLERQIHDAAHVRATRGSRGRGAAVMQEELLAYAVEEAVLRGVRPTLEGREGSAEQWLGDVVATLQGVVFEVTQGALPKLDAQGIVDLAYALAQLENPSRGQAIRDRLGDGCAEIADRLHSLVMDAHAPHLGVNFAGGPAELGMVRRQPERQAVNHERALRA